jgi:hypothetical protein
MSEERRAYVFIHPSSIRRWAATYVHGEKCGMAFYFFWCLTATTTTTITTVNLL